MKKFKYLFKRIFHMDYKNFINTINKVKLKTGRNKAFIFFDMVICGLKYQSGYVDYYLFAMYNMNNKEKKTIVTRGVSNQIVKKLNNQAYNKYFSDKVIFNEIFSKYLNREWLYLNDQKEFKKFVKNKEEIIVKPIDACCGKGIEKIKLKNQNIESLYKNLVKNNQLLIEEVAKQNLKINKLHPYSINTVRIVTINNGEKTTIVAAFLRIGTNKNVVDNFNSGGICCRIDIGTGKIKYPGVDKHDHIYITHPLTKIKLLNYQIPLWKETQNLCIEAATIVPEIGYTAWDVCIGEKVPFLIEGNEYPGHDLYELPVQKETKYGMKPLIEKAMQKKGKIK